MSRAARSSCSARSPVSTWSAVSSGVAVRNPTPCTLDKSAWPGWVVRSSPMPTSTPDVTRRPASKATPCTGKPFPVVGVPDAPPARRTLFGAQEPLAEQLPRTTGGLPPVVGGSPPPPPGPPPTELHSTRTPADHGSRIGERTVRRTRVVPGSADDSDEWSLSSTATAGSAVSACSALTGRASPRMVSSVTTDTRLALGPSLRMPTSTATLARRMYHDRGIRWAPRKLVAELPPEQFVLLARQRIGLTRPVELLLSTTSGSPRYEIDPALFNAASSDSSTHNRASPELFSATVARVLRTDSPR